MNKTNDFPSELKFPLHLDLKAEEYRGLKGQLKALSLRCIVWQAGKPIHNSTDYSPDNALSRQKLQFRVGYFSAHLEDALREAINMFFNESAFATEIANGGNVEAALERWNDAVSPGAKARIQLPERRGRITSLDEEAVNNMDLIQANELAKIQSAKKIFKKFETNPLLGDWRRILRRILGRERFECAEKGLMSLDPYEAQPSAITYAYLAKHYGLSKRQLERVVSNAKKRRGALKRYDRPNSFASP